MSLIDVLPTLIELAGIDSELPMQGRDLTRVVRGDAAVEEDDWAFASALPEETASLAAQNERFKLILDLESGERELYDLAKDPGEQRDIAPESQELSARLIRRVESHLETLSEYPAYRPALTPLSEEDIERLRSLGYVQ